LQLRYVTTEALQRRQVAEILAKGLAECGVGLQVEYVPANEVYAPGPGGPLFGRSFDLAAYAVGPASGEFPCSWFSSDQIPSAENNWIGLNISGYTNPDYDALCRKAMRILPDQPGYGDAHAQVQQVFANDLPVVPLYVHIKAAAARRDLCNFSLEAAALSELWNIEELDIDPACTEN
jgi:peptide/nickel transport system substrate-binding protein